MPKPWRRDVEEVSTGGCESSEELGLGAELRGLLLEQGALLRRDLGRLLESQELILARLEERQPPLPPPHLSEATTAAPLQPPSPASGAAATATPSGSARHTVATMETTRSSAAKEVVKAREALSEKGEPVGLLSRAYRTRGAARARHSRSSNRSSRSQADPAADAATPTLQRPQTPSGDWRQWREALSHEMLFDVLASSMILANALLMGVETEYAAREGGGSHRAFLFAQIALNVWFVVELFLRVVVVEKCRLRGGDWRWNAFDAGLVAFSLADLVQVAQVGLARSVSSTGRLMRIIRLARVLRLARLCRNLNHVHQFRKMVYCLQASLSTLAWVLLLLLTVMYAFAVLFVQGVVEFVAYGENGGDAELTRDLLQHYGGILPAISTLYKAVTGGQSWTELMEPLEVVDGSLSVLFLAYISTVFFGVLNVVTAVFVESAMDSAAHYKDLRIYESRKSKESLVRHMKTVFNQIDADGSGTVNYQEMDHFLHDVQLRMYVESLGVTLEDTVMLFQLMDLDDSGNVDIEEFCNGLLRLQGDARSFDVHLLMFEMAKLQSKWDNFVAYFCLRFDECESSADAVPSVALMRERLTGEEAFSPRTSSRWSHKLSNPAAAERSAERAAAVQRCFSPRRRASLLSASPYASLAGSASLASWSLHRLRSDPDKGP